jgi:hypothetical protein
MAVRLQRFKDWPQPTPRRNGRLTLLVDRQTELKSGPSSADVVKTIQDKGYEQRTVLIFMDRSKNGRGVGSGMVIFIQQKLAVQLQFRLENRC